MHEWWCCQLGFLLKQTLRSDGWEYHLCSYHEPTFWKLSPGQMEKQVLGKGGDTWHTLDLVNKILMWGFIYLPITERFHLKTRSLPSLLHTLIGSQEQHGIRVTWTISPQGSFPRVWEDTYIIAELIVSTENVGGKKWCFSDWLSCCVCVYVCICVFVCEREIFQDCIENNVEYFDGKNPGCNSH